MPGATLSSKIYNSELLVILGDTNGVFMTDKVSEYLGRMLGPEHVEFGPVRGGHGFSVPSRAEVKHSLEFGGLYVVSCKIECGLKIMNQVANVG